MCFPTFSYIFLGFSLDSLRFSYILSNFHRIFYDFLLLVLIELLLLAVFLVSHLISRWFRLNVANHQKSNNIINSISQNGGFSPSFKNNTLISWDRRGLASTSIYQQRCDSWRYQRHQRAEKCNTSLSRNFPLLWAKFNKAEPLNIDGCRGSETFAFFPWTFVSGPCYKLTASATCDTCDKLCTKPFCSAGLWVRLQLKNLKNHLVI